MIERKKRIEINPSVFACEDYGYFAKDCANTKMKKKDASHKAKWSDSSQSDKKFLYDSKE